MTVRNLYELYKQGLGVEKPIVLCDYKNGDGYRIENLAQFDKVMEQLEQDERDLFLLSTIEQEKFVYFEYFTMDRTEPLIAIVRHPHLSNAYWKDRPDYMIDTITIMDRVYRYVSIDYGNLLKELVIELPTSIDDDVFKLLKKRFPEAFYNNVRETNASYSLVFTNTDRFDDKEQLGYKTIALNGLYPELKRPTIKSVSQKFWKELKALA